MHNRFQYCGHAVYKVLLLIPWIKRSTRRIHKSFSAWVLFLLLLNFLHSGYTCYTTRTPSAVYLGLKGSPLPVSHKKVRISEATVSVQQFLSKTRKLVWKRGELSISYQQQDHRKHLVSLTTGQWLACLICIPIDLCHRLYRQGIVLAVVYCCAVPLAQMFWGLCPSLDMTQLSTAPGELVVAPLADAVCIDYVYRLLLVPAVQPYHYLLAVLAINRTDPVSHSSVFLLMAVVIIPQHLFERLPARHPQHDSYGRPDRVIHRQSWYIVYPSTALIAMLLVIGGIEVNPGPIANITLIILMVMTLPAKRQRLEGNACVDCVNGVCFRLSISSLLLLFLQPMLSCAMTAHLQLSICPATLCWTSSMQMTCVS